MSSFVYQVNAGSSEKNRSVPLKACFSSGCTLF